MKITQLSDVFTKIVKKYDKIYSKKSLLTTNMASGRLRNLLQTFRIVFLFKFGNTVVILAYTLSLEFHGVYFLFLLNRSPYINKLIAIWRVKLANVRGDLVAKVFLPPPFDSPAFQAWQRILMSAATKSCLFYERDQTSTWTITCQLLFRPSLGVCWHFHQRRYCYQDKCTCLLIS